MINTGLILNKENRTWLNLLTSNNEEATTANEMFGILELRENLLKQGRGQDITIDSNNLISTLTQLFLEPITKSEIDYFVSKSNLTLENLIQLHKSHLTLRFSSILHGWKTLLKQDARKYLM